MLMCEREIFFVNEFFNEAEELAEDLKLWLREIMHCLQDLK